MLSARLISVSWLLGLTHLLTQSHAVISSSEVLSINKVSKDVTEHLLKAWSLLNQNVDFNELPLPIFYKTEHNLFEKIQLIISKIEDFGGRVNSLGTRKF